MGTAEQTSFRSAGRRLALVLALGGLAFGLSFACLPDLAAFPGAPDAASDASELTSSACGDGVIETLEDGGDAGESCDPGDASVAGCEGCAITCPNGALDVTGHCYFWADDQAVFSEAFSACQAARGHLVTFASQREVDFVTSALAPDAGYWVGLLLRADKGGYAPPFEFNEPGWPDPASGKGCPGCFALGADGGAFAPAPADAGTQSLSCLVAQDGTWRAIPCSNGTKLRTLCEREPVGDRIYPCGGLLCTTLQLNAGKKRYVVGTGKVSAEEAAEFCRGYKGGSLVMFDSREEREQLVREIAQRFQSGPADVVEFWIGLARPDGGAWTWDDGTSADDAGARPSPWGENQPSGNGTRAFLRIDDTSYDTQLARTDEDAPPQEGRVFVCQRPVE